MRFDLIQLLKSFLCLMEECTSDKLCSLCVLERSKLPCFETHFFGISSWGESYISCICQGFQRSCKSCFDLNDLPIELRTSLQ